MIVSKLAPLTRYGVLFGRSLCILPKNVYTPASLIQIVQKRPYSEQGLQKSDDSKNSRSDVSTDVRPLGEKIKESAKTASYTGVIIVGVGITGIIFYYVFRELFSSQSPNSIYSSALDRCIQDPEIIEALGAPIKGFGEESSRRRRNRVSHAFYERDGAKCIRMQFYIRGVRNEGTVQVDMKEVNGRFEYRYLLVQLGDYSRKVIILEDNRAEVDKKPLTLLPNIGDMPNGLMN